MRHPEGRRAVEPDGHTIGDGRTGDAGVGWASHADPGAFDVGRYTNGMGLWLLGRRLRNDWREPAMRLTLAAVPVTAVVLWLLGRLRVVAPEPLWLLLVVMAMLLVCSTAATVWFDLRRSRARMHQRIAFQILGTTLVMYITGWGPVLVVGYALIAHDTISTVGSRAWRPVVGWSVTGLTIGQLAIAVGLAPSLVAQPDVHGLAVLAGLGTAFIIGVLGFSAARAEDAERSLRGSEERLRTTIETASEAYIEIDGSGLVMAWNNQAEVIFGWSREETTGRLLEELIIPIDQREAHRRGLERYALVGGGTVLGRRFELLALHRDGHQFPVELAIWPIKTPNGWRFNAFAHDISERKRAEAALQDSEESFRLLFERNPQPMWVYDLVTLRFLQVNEAAVDHYGYSRPEFLDMSIGDILPEEADPAPIEQIATAGDGVKRARLGRHRTKPGQTIDVEITSHQLELAGQQCRLVMAQDITDRLRAARELVHRALHDGLTGLPNRNLLLDRLGQALTRSERSGDRVAVIFVGLDRFKIINDAKGYHAGDRLLVEVACRMKQAIRSGDTVSRIGGDQFAIVEGVANEVEASTASSRIAWALDAPFTIEGYEFFVSASQGIALAEPGDSAEVVLAKADVAMYSAKDRGRSRSEFADEAVWVRASNVLDLESAMRRAVDRDEFVLHYQPVVAVSSGEVIGAEALLRWRHPDGHLWAPAQFIAAAEESGLIVPIGEWVLHQALKDAREWGTRTEEGSPLSIAVNLSAAQLMVPNLPFVVARALSSSGVKPSRLHLEITESVLMYDLQRSVKTLAALRGLGISIDVDDFGTGYSSLTYVQRLPVDALKIDKSFVDRLDGPDQDCSIVTAVVNLGRSLNLAVVAEGVETEHQHAVLRELGCPFAQGFRFARPIAAAAFVELLSAGPLPQPYRGAPMLSAGRWAS